MLNPDVAREKLESFADEGWEARRRAAIQQLPNKARKAAQFFMEDGRRRSLDWREQGKAEEQAAGHLDGLHRDERYAMLEALFPEIAPHVEQTWSMLARYPYQRGYSRKAFRAPNTLLTSRMRRFTWLTSLWNTVKRYDKDVAWLAAWAPYLGYYAPDTLGCLFAAAVSSGGSEGDAVFDVLCASAKGEHEIGAMGRHVTSALLMASRVDGWAFIERLLLAAQLQEGLRQVIVETVDLAHPEAFRRMLRLILDHNLMRFSAVVRAIDVWFDIGFGASEQRQAADVLATAALMLDERETRAEVLATGDGRKAYLALWSLAFEDAVATLSPAAQMLTDADVERRFAATHLLAQLGLVGASSALITTLQDTDLRVVTRAVAKLKGYYANGQDAGDLFERVEQIVSRFPAKRTILQPILWPSITLSADRADAIGLLIDSLGDRSPKRLFKYLPSMNAGGRCQTAKLLAGAKRWDGETRDALFSLVGDPSGQVRDAALKAIADCRLEEREAMRVEILLARRDSDLRRGVMTLLLKQDDEAALASVERLLTANEAGRSLAGLELLRELKSAHRRTESCCAAARRYLSTRTHVDAQESRILNAILEDEPQATLEDALGLLDLRQRTKPERPRGKLSRVLGREVPLLVTPAAASLLKSLDALVHCNRNQRIVLTRWEGQREEVLLGDAEWRFPSTNAKVPIEQDLGRLPLQDIWTTWWHDRPGEARDDDGFELLRANAPFVGMSYSFQRQTGPSWLQKAHRALFLDLGAQNLRYHRIVDNVLRWLLRLYPPEGGVGFLLNAIEYSASLIPSAAFPKKHVEGSHDWARDSRVLGWVALARFHRQACPPFWEDVHHARLWRLLRWIDEPTPATSRHRASIGETLAALKAGAATDYDVLDHLLGSRPTSNYGRSFGSLRELTGRKPSPLFEQYPWLGALVELCRKRVVEVELKRGDLPTAASEPATALQTAGGLETLAPVLTALGRDDFVRGWIGGSPGKAAVFSHLVRVTFPSDADTPERFAEAMAAAAIPQQRLVELAFYAPQWAGHVEHSLEWEGLAEGVLWIMAHTKDRQSQVDRDTRDAWTAQIAEHTPVSAQSLMDGAVDVAWFWRTYRALGEEHWNALYEAARFGSTGRGHERARRFADAMLGRVSKADLIAAMMKKRNQDAARALGLLPLAEGDEREQDILERYEVLQEFLRTSRKFGPQRRENEKLAVAVALENLARSACYPDPLRLQWAMEARLADGTPDGCVTVGDVSVTMSVDVSGKPNLAVTKGGRRLKSIPGSISRDPSIVALRARQTEIRRQARRVRLSLEQAMCRGDHFSVSEMRELFRHPVMAPMLRGLVFLGRDVAGYPVERGLALEDHNGTISPVSDTESLYLAHPSDLVAAGDWHLWQRECFAHERIQPFKQVFRELYVVTKTEQDEGTISRRYAGHQVQPRQALALLGQRGWVNHPELGMQRTFPEVSLSARLTFVGGAFTPAEVEGLTIEGVEFGRYGVWKPVPLAEIPPRVFSETMRDVDLVVSVAHCGGVDPEASASTVEMRASLVRQTCAMLDIANVELQGVHALIEGNLRSYSVHLGSAVVHRQPGGALCIVAVQAQHRGRLFLPFADDDPRTAEVLSKILLLARDKEIKDPTILEQILA